MGVGREIWYYRERLQKYFDDLIWELEDLLSMLEREECEDVLDTVDNALDVAKDLKEQLEGMCIELGT